MAATDACFHCGEPLPPAGAPRVVVEGQPRAVCCNGCRAAVEFVLGAGLNAFYRHRTEAAPRPDEQRRDWQAWDRPGALDSVGVLHDDGRREAGFTLDGIRCAACVWLIERALGDIDGVESVAVNPASGRLNLLWNPKTVRLSHLLATLDRLGYTPRPLDGTERADRQRAERRSALKRLGVAGLGMVQVMMYAAAVYIGDAQDMSADFRAFFTWVSMLIATPVVLYAGRPFFANALREFAARRPGMDTPVALAIGGAYAASVYNSFHGGETYFDSVIMFVFFLTVGRFLETAARHRAGETAEALASALPATARRLTDNPVQGTVVQEIAVAELVAGDRVRVAAGETVPADARVLADEALLDEGLLTGESRPVTRTRDDEVLAGSTNRGAAFDAVVIRTGGSSRLADMTRLMDRALGHRPRLARTTDRVAAWFVTGVLGLTATVFAVWWQIAPDRAFEIALSVLVVTCPCALSLATPAALTVAVGRMARLGLLVTRSDAVETLARVDRVFFDKTGTLTRGRPELTKVRTFGAIGVDEARRIAAALEAHSTHPLAGAFRVDAPAEARTVTEHRGRGVEGTVDGRRYRLGQPAYAATISGSASIPGAGVVLADESGPLAMFHFTDDLRDDAAETADALRRLGLEPEVLSGDHHGPARETAWALGIERYQARLMPDDKLARLRAVQDRRHVVCMVGDGINDAPVLGGANVSIAMDRGSALARSGADMILTGGRLGAVPAGIRLAHRTVAIIRQNLAWALGYNLVAVPLATAGLVAPWAAALGMSASSLVVVFNALRIRRAPDPAARHAPAQPGRVAEAT